LRRGAGELISMRVLSPAWRTEMLLFRNIGLAGMNNFPMIERLKIDEE
jgi:hypothetical protein